MFGLPTFGLMPVTQIFSLQAYFSQLAGGESVHPFRTVADYDNWLARIDDYVVWVDTSIGNMRAASSAASSGRRCSSSA